MTYDDWKTAAPALDGSTHTDEGEPIQAAVVTEPLMHARARVEQELKAIAMLAYDMDKVLGVSFTPRDMNNLITKAHVIRRAADGMLRALDGVVEDDIKF